jgi:hypothetical protein
MNELSELRECFKEDFTEWLLNSNCPDVGPFKGEWWIESSKMRILFYKIESKSLQDIFDILKREPLADYFWYTYKEHGGRLTYSLPHYDVVPGDALRVDGDKIKVFLRNCKLSTILND